MNNRRIDARMVRALLASVTTGVVIYLIVIRGAFNAHPWVVLGSITMIAAILALPVLVAFRIVYGPMKGHWRRRPL